MADGVTDNPTVKKRGDAIIKEITRYEKLSVFVGFQGKSALESKEESDATVVDVATFNEFGTDATPERSFLRSSMDDHRDDIGKVIEEGLAAIIDGKKTAIQAASTVGILAQSLVRKRIVELDSPPNSDVTIAIKGSSSPLVDTGQMIQSVTWTVRLDKEILAEG